MIFVVKCTYACVCVENFIRTMFFYLYPSFTFDYLLNRFTGNCLLSNNLCGKTIWHFMNNKVKKAKGQNVVSLSVSNTSTIGTGS